MGLDKSILKAKKMIGLDRGKEKIITVAVLEEEELLLKKNFLI